MSSELTEFGQVSIAKAREIFRNFPEPESDAEKKLQLKSGSRKQIFFEVETEISNQNETFLESDRVSE